MRGMPVVAATSSTARLVVSGGLICEPMQMQNPVGRMPWTHLMLQRAAACLSATNCLMFQGLPHVHVVAGVGPGRVEGRERARREKNARMGMKHSMLETTNFAMQTTLANKIRQRRASENGNRDAGTGGTVAERVSPHPGKVRHAAAGCDSERDRPSINDSASQPGWRISCLSGVPLAPLPQSPGRANEKTDGWIIRRSKWRCSCARLPEQKPVAGPRHRVRRRIGDGVAVNAVGSMTGGTGRESRFADAGSAACFRHGDDVTIHPSFIFLRRPSRPVLLAHHHHEQDDEINAWQLLALVHT